MFSKIRYSIGERNLAKKAALQHRQKIVRNFTNCHDAGIIFDGSSTEDFSIVKDFMKYLSARKIESSLIGYVDADTVRDSYLLWKNCHFFCKKDLDFFYRPKTEMSNEFLKKNLTSCLILH